MVDNRSTSPAATHATGRSPPSTNNAPPGYGIRRAKTVDEGISLRRRSSFNPGSARSSFTEAQRRDSSFGDFSDNNHQGDADGLWNLGKMANDPPDQSMAATLPLVLALLPAVGGLMFEGGSAFFTDIILLGLSGLFLRWSVTQPWNWYHAAQEVRVAKDMAMSTPVFENDSDLELSTAASVTTALEQLPEEDEKRHEHEDDLHEPSQSAGFKKRELERATAAKKLRRHEKFALLWCFVFPLLAAYLLHTIRGQLSSRSEGLVSDFNLYIFVIAAEIRPVTHAIKLLQNSTLHKQRILAANPYEQQDARDEQLQELQSRIEELEARFPAGEAATMANPQEENATVRTIETLVSRNYRERVQPEVESVTRAMRRYEKKLSNIIDQIDIRLEYLDQRSNDAIALAAIAARQQNDQESMMTWLVGQAVTVFLLPFRTIFAVFVFPFRTISSLLEHTSISPSEKHHKRARRASGSGRVTTERLSSRVSRK